MNFAHGLYSEAEDREAAVGTESRYSQNSGVYGRSYVQATVLHQGRQLHHKKNRRKERPQRERTAHNVSMRLKDNKKFSVDIGECWYDFVDYYKQISCD